MDRPARFLRSRRSRLVVGLDLVDALVLGPLAGNLGNQNHAIPEGTDLSRYASVVIWCDRFGVTFGAAPLA